LLTHNAVTKPFTLGEFSASLTSLARFESLPFLAVAVSGGPDSLALAILADRWARERGGEMCALTVDHGLRPEGGGEIHRLRNWLSARGIHHEVLVWAGEKPRTGIQEAARFARYQLLDGWCRDHACLHLLIGHQSDDQIETHLMRRRAHSGPGGLAGMSAIRDLANCRLLRPLLGVARDRLAAFLDTERQPFITDPSNLDPVFERGRLRGSGGVPRNEADIFHLLAEIRAFGARRVAREDEQNGLLARCVSLHPAGFGLLNSTVLRETGPEIAVLALSALAAAIGGASYPARRERLARLRDVLDAAVRRGHTLGGCRFSRWRECILVTRELAKAPLPLRLRAGESVTWDRRFEVVPAPTGNRGFTVGYLGQAGKSWLDRGKPEFQRACLPRPLFPILPAVWDEEAIAAVPHLGYRREGIVDLPQLVFRPVNTLTRAAFAVV
jgi:tRNA(Ile)-lysidine synthase